MAEYLGAFAFFALVAGQFVAVVAVNNWQPETLEIDEKADFAHPVLAQPALAYPMLHARE